MMWTTKALRPEPAIALGYFRDYAALVASQSWLAVKDGEHWYCEDPLLSLHFYSWTLLHAPLFPGIGKSLGSLPN
jgi:hypothetical protein